MHRKHKHRKHKEMEEEDVPLFEKNARYTGAHTRMPIRPYDAHDENKPLNTKPTITSKGTSTNQNMDPSKNLQVDFYTSVYGKKFKIVERDKDGNPTAIADASGKVYHNNFGKFPVDATGDDAKMAQQQIDAKITAGLKTGGEVVGAIGSAYSAYQGVKEIYNYLNPEELINELPTAEELEQLPTEEEITAAFEELSTTLDEAAIMEPSIEEIGANIWQRFTNYFPEYSGQVPFNNPKPAEYANELHGEELEAAEEAAAETEGVEGLATLTEGGVAVAESVAAESWFEAALDVVEGLGEVALELAPLGI